MSSHSAARCPRMWGETLHDMVAPIAIKNTPQEFDNESFSHIQSSIFS